MHSCRNVLAIGLAAFATVSYGAHNGKEQSKSDQSTASITDNEMGPAAFLWPPDRVWSGDMDNEAPCGSSASPGERAKFPLTGGYLALVAQDDYYNSKISISYDKNPTKNEDFTQLVPDKPEIQSLNPGHTCVRVPDAPDNVKVGSNATLQIIYRADWDAPVNQTFYACADITYVAASDFQPGMRCLDATELGEDDRKAGKTAGSGGDKSGNKGNGEVSTSSSSSSSKGDSSSGSDSGNDSGSSKLGSGAIAGIVVGSIAGVSFALAALLFWYRRKHQKERQLRLARMEENARRDQFPMQKYAASQHS